MRLILRGGRGDKRAFRYDSASVTFVTSFQRAWTFLSREGNDLRRSPDETISIESIPSPSLPPLSCLCRIQGGVSRWKRLPRRMSLVLPDVPCARGSGRDCHFSDGCQWQARSRRHRHWRQEGGGRGGGIRKSVMLLVLLSGSRHGRLAGARGE